MKYSFKKKERKDFKTHSDVTKRVSNTLKQATCGDPQPAVCSGGRLYLGAGLAELRLLLPPRRGVLPAAPRRLVQRQGVAVPQGHAQNGEASVKC